MEPLALKLEMLKGPRKGETLEYRPGSKIRIGRVVRGNNLPIKDSGISTNHLVIDSESGQWMVRDLDSSNGTIVNDTTLKPNTPFELSDGDEIKIGEYTSISVKIDGCEEASRLRRNPRRAAVVKVGAAAASRGRRGRVAAESEVVQVEVKSEVVVENCEEIGGGEERAPGRRGRARKKNEAESDLEEIEVVEKPKRGRGRPPKKAKVLKSEEDVVEEAAVPAVVNCDDRGEVPEQKHSGEIGPVDDDDAKGLDLEDERHEEAAVDFDVGVSVIDNEKAKESNLGHEEAEVDFGMVESGNDSKKAKESRLGHEEAAIDCSVGGDKVESGSRSSSGAHGATDVDKKGSGSGVKEALGKIWQEEPDLEKMTLDDWFDYVEVSWPKVVNDEIDKICAGMREKARLVQEYIAQHKKGKGQS